MRIVAIETSGRDASLAMLEGEPAGIARLQGESDVTGPERTAQLLAPRLSELLQTVDWPAKTIGLVAVAVGPGSFTGLRIGVTAAKTLAYATGAQLVGVDTLAIVAAQAPPAAEALWVVMDAQRQELFVAKFSRDRQVVAETRILSRPDWLAELAPGDSVAGPGLRRLNSPLPPGVVVVDESLWQPRAATLGALGWRDHCAGRRDDVWQLVPQYYRPSAAQEKWDRERRSE